MENTITITLDEYNELIEKAERIKAVERLLTSGRYLTLSDVLPVLGIDEAKENDNETV